MSSESPEHEPEVDLPDDEDDDAQVGNEPEVDEGERELSGDLDGGAI